MCPSEHFLSCAWRLTREVSTVDTLQKTSNCYRLPGTAGGPPYGLVPASQGRGINGRSGVTATPRGFLNANLTCHASLHVRSGAGPQYVEDAARLRRAA